MSAIIFIGKYFKLQRAFILLLSLFETKDLTQITFEMYERNQGFVGDKEYSLRVGFSPGAHDPNILDLQLDARHCLNVAPRK